MSRETAHFSPDQPPEEALRLLLGSIKDYAIFTLDCDGHVTSWNPGAHQIKGYAAAEILGQSMTRFYTQEDRDTGLPGELLRLAEKDGRVEHEGWRVRKDGSRFWADVVISKLSSAEGKHLGFVKVTRDLTERKAAENALREREESLSATLYSIGDAVIATDADARITRLNPVAERLTGWLEAEARGRPIDDVFRIVNEDTRIKAENPISRVLREGIVVGLANHTALIARDGTETPIADSGAPIRDASGQIRGVVLVFRDIAKERQMEAALVESEERLRLMVERVKDYAIFMLDARGCVTSWNAGARGMKGYTANEILGQPMSLFYTVEDRRSGLPAELLRVADRDGRVESEGWRVRKDGSTFWADVVITRVSDDDGRLLGYAKVTRDLTERKAAENALRESEESLSATLYSIGDAVIATDRNANITRMNPVAAKLTGWAETDARGRPIDEVFRIINEDTRLGAANPVHRVLREGVVVGLANHTALVARDGSEIPIADSGAPIHDGSGVQGVVLVFRDTTKERKMEAALIESEQRLRLMIESVKDYAIFMLDPQGCVATWNSGAERLMGHSAQEILGNHFSIFYPPDVRSAGVPERELRIATEKGVVEEEGWRIRKDGSRFLATAVISAIRDDKGTLLGFAKLTHDVTERRRMEQDIQEQRSRTAAAQIALRDRDEFISVAAHELRTPLTTLQLKLQGLDRLLARGPASTALPETTGHRLEGVIKQTQHLADLVERLLDVSRIAAGKLDIQSEELDLSELVRQVVDDIRAPALQKGSEIRLEAKRPVRGVWDRTRLQQLMVNLLSNAIKYGDSKPIDVSVEKLDERGRIVVSDRGIGISAHDVDRIFGRFERAAPPQHFSGLGLGLYIARYIAEAHGGSVKVESQPGQGSTFVVELPTRHSKASGDASDGTMGSRA